MHSPAPHSRVSSVVLLSGGLDSAANLALCVERDEAILALTVRYGQRAEAREVRAAERLSAYYGVPHETADAHWLGALGGSSLTQSSLAMPDPGRENLDDLAKTRESAKAVWVPNRNGVLINIAAACAERRGAARVVVGFNREEAVTFPDNSIEFLDKASAALALSTATGVRVHSYTAELDKREIVRALRELRRPFPFDLLWSCYQGGEKPCGTCESCRRLARALGEGGS